MPVGRENLTFPSNRGKPDDYDMKKIVKKLLVNSKGTPRSLVKFLLFDELSKCRSFFEFAVYGSDNLVRSPLRKWVMLETQNPTIHALNKWPDERRLIIDRGDLENVKNISIVSNKQTLFLAELLKRHLNSFGFFATIDSKYSTETLSDLYLVICPQAFEELPPPNKRIVYQMEQSISPRWFTREYINVLYNSLAIFDYAKCNKEFLISKKIPENQIFYVPLAPSNKSNNTESEIGFLNPIHKVSDVLFYGDLKNKRRQKYLKELKRHFNIRVETNLFGAALHEAIAQTKVVVNIHYYEGAILESTRVCECLSLGATVVSEMSSNQGEHLDWEDMVTFTPVGDIQAMIEAIRDCLKEGIHLQSNSENSEFQMRVKLLEAFRSLNMKPSKI